VTLDLADRYRNIISTVVYHVRRLTMALMAAFPLMAIRFVCAYV
jgi:hypothetical protein